MDMQQFNENRRRFPPEQLVKYAGRYVAWSPDGASILASGDDEGRLDRLLAKQGHDTSEILITFVPPLDEVVLGGGFREKRCDGTRPGAWHWRP